jgi:hypothetical protein
MAAMFYWAATALIIYLALPENYVYAFQMSSGRHRSTGKKNTFIRDSLLKAASSNDSSDSDLSEFREWCTQKGIITPLDLDVRTGDDAYRFMKYSNDKSFASRPDKINGPILRVSLKACIVAESPEDLAVELAKERDLGEESDFAPYIKVLPSLSSPSLQSMPRFWSQEKLEKVSEFDGGLIYQRVQSVKEQCKELNLDEWALAIVNSRANFLLDEGYAMTPILDMINHNSASKTSARIMEDELFLSVENEFAKGEEVFISYGSFSNLETMCEYGFVDSKSNQCNQECVDIRMIRQQPVRVTIDDQNDGELDPGSLALLRSYLASPEEVEDLLANDESLSINTVYAKPISEAVEEEVYSFIASFVDEAIYDATTGITWAHENGEDLIENFLVCRVAVLEKGLQFMKRKFPELLY